MQATQLKIIRFLQKKRKEKEDDPQNFFELFRIAWNFKV